jgi:hypothetical protein
MTGAVILQSGAFLATGGIVITATILFAVLWLVNRYEQRLANR